MRNVSDNFNPNDPIAQAIAAAEAKTNSAHMGQQQAVYGTPPGAGTTVKDEAEMYDEGEIVENQPSTFE